ncbi:MAG: transposase [Patescibacteria group bacterium]
MPSRKIVLAKGELYHVFNRGNAKQPIFLQKRDYQRFLKTVSFYQFVSPPIRLSKFLILSKERRVDLLKNLTWNDKKLVEIACYCFMPNHFHFLIKQVGDCGISEFIGQIQNSYTKYFNVKRERVGSLLQGRFKAVRVESEEQLIHLSRYIHLNPYSSFLVKSLEDLKKYPWSSFLSYLEDEKVDFLDENIILNLFKNREEYQEFIFNQADYQRELEKIKHLTLDI